MPTADDASTLDHYQLIAEIGRGGMAEVHLALAQGPNGFHKLVVIKRIRAHLAEDADARTMFMDEARLAGRLSHTNVVQTLEVAEHEGRLYLVMEYLEGQPFAAILARSRQLGKPIGLVHALVIVREALEGLRYAHQLKDFDGSPLHLVHRDISPQNIFVTYDGRIKILDFGIAKAAISEMETRAGMLKGKIAYMAPEQALGEAVDARADLYSIGAVLWDLAAGRRLWKGMAEGQALYRTVEGNIPAPSSVHPGVDPRLESVCMRALATQPADRFQDAASLANEVDALIAALGGRPTAAELGDLVADLFDDVRRDTEQLVADRVAEISRNTPSVHFVPELAASGGWNHSGTLPRFGRSSAPPSTDPSGASAVLSVQEPPRKKSRTPIVIVLVALLACAAGVAAFVTSGREEPAPAASVSSATADPTPAASIATRAVTESAPPSAKPRPLEIHVDPATASVFVDDRKSYGDPVVVEFEAKGERRSVRIEAKGYRAKSFEVVEGLQTSMHVALAALGTSRAAHEAAEEQPDDIPAVEPPAPADPPPVAEGEPIPDTARDRIKSLDTSNPWGG